LANAPLPDTLFEVHWSGGGASLRRLVSLGASSELAGPCGFSTLRLDSQQASPLFPSLVRHVEWLQGSVLALDLGEHRLEVSVYDSQGAPAPYARLALDQYPQFTRSSFDCDAAGRLTLQVPPGSYRLYAESRIGQTAEVEASVEVYGDTSVTLHLDP
jgi:hypothetical protein